MTQTFIDTLVICTLTGLVILTTVARDAERAESADAPPLAEVVERLAPAVEAGRLDLAAPDLPERADELAPGTGAMARLARWRLVSGSESTALAFREGLPGGFGGAVVSIGLALFAFSTILGWSYYGEKSVEYLLGVRAVTPYRLLFAAMVVGGPAWLGTTAVWTFSDVMNGLMAIPNLIGLLLLSGVVVAETRAWLAAQEDAE
jgi:Na+/alanine symporter